MGDHWKAGVVIKNDGHREEGRGTEREHGGQQTDVLVSLGGVAVSKASESTATVEQGGQGKAGVCSK